MGISGWRYAGWRKVFYPDGLPQKNELEYAAERMGSIEINGSFYSLQRPSSYRNWRDAAPDDFVFSVKGSRYITHIRRLRDVEGPLANFFASGVLELEHKLGPFLWQFPPNLTYDGRFAEFFELLPRDTKQASELAENHDERVPEFQPPKGKRREVRHAIEVRNKSFRNEEFIELLRKHRIALVVADTAKRFPYMEDVTAPFVYVRLHGDKEIYESGYTKESIGQWAQRIEAWAEGGEPTKPQTVSSKRPRRAKGRDVYAYFDNDMKVHAPFDAMALQERLGI